MTMTQKPRFGITPCKLPRIWTKEVAPYEKETDLLEVKKQELKKAVEEERYEDAAKIRDEIKKIKSLID